MFEMVEAPIDNIEEFITQDGWYTKHSWSEEKEKEFNDWLSDHLYTNKEAYKQIGKYSRTKKHCRQTAEWFTFMYGWKRDR